MLTIAVAASQESQYPRNLLSSVSVMRFAKKKYRGFLSVAMSHCQMMDSWFIHRLPDKGHSMFFITTGNNGLLYESLQTHQKLKGLQVKNKRKLFWTNDVMLDALRGEQAKGKHECSLLPACPV